jgi:glutamyl-tRNA reductase
MIAEQTTHFLRWLEGRSVVPTIAALSKHHDGLRSAELERARRLLANGAAPEQALEALARGLTNKLLHAPLAALNGAGEAERAELIALLTRVYGLAEDAPAPATPGTVACAATEVSPGAATGDAPPAA